MGYAKEGQNTKGIHMRLFSRAFVFDDGLKRNVFVSADCGMIDQLIKIEVRFNL
jgi:neutral ceramidase